MRAGIKPFAFLTLLAVVFTIGLTFASIELPRLLDSFLSKNIDTPDVATGLNALSDYKTDLYLRFTHLRWIGYGCLVLIIVMIVVGFLTEKSGWTSAGALLLFLPVFGHFAATMFFLGGLGFLRLLWLPILDASFRLFRLGDVINWPYNALLGLYSRTGLGRWVKLSTLITGLGLLIFFLGTLTWFYARARKKGVADLWVYRWSRHPQYLGWIVWSYGVMFLQGSDIKLNYELSNSLPWLLSTMIIIGVAMLEELKMKKAYGEAYEAYRRRAPFLIPLPRFIGRAFAFPHRLIFKKPYPERKREIVAVLAFYTVLLLGISAFYGGLIAWPGKKANASPPPVEELVGRLKTAGNRAERRRAADLLAGMGEPAVDPLIVLLKDEDAIVRAYSAGALGGTKSERAVAPLIALLDDGDSYVRRTGVEALGKTGSPLAIPPLVSVLQNQTKEAPAAARSLGQIHHPDVIPPLLAALQDPAPNTIAAAAQSLAALGAKEAIDPLIQCYENLPQCPFDVIGTALWKLGSDRAADAWIAGLKKGSWWYPRAFCAEILGKNKLEKGLPALQEALKDEAKEVRRAVVLALMEFQSEKTVEALQQALADKDFEVRMYAKAALKRIRSGPFGCTIIMAARNGLVLAGNNEDRNHPKTIVAFLPADAKYYGRIIFGYDDAPVQGGMNDRGLFIDGNALAPTGWKPEPDKPTFRGNVMMVILGTCATCEDVKAFFEKSNIPALGQARFPVADRTGASMVVEYGQGRVQFVKPDAWYQIATNFVMSNVTDGNYPCWRYRTADAILSGAKELNVELIRDVLDKTHQEGGSLTVYSNIYDLKNGIIHIYNLRNFEEAVVLKLTEELKKGARRLELSSLFEKK